MLGRKKKEDGSLTIKQGNLNTLWSIPPRVVTKLQSTSIILFPTYHNTVLNLYNIRFLHTGYDECNVLEMR